ncbi:hypothetical protein L3Q65_08275 [Amycolatopsis sp. FU40]|uniref:hypothetical protein n=1 Tax=Amycolatopsis sp. FU40 TaxID=2914159 RepID=UPI001F250AD3|nr:hypothetical protein [Amycolatopsis sp. FU40]UKD56703.1 hypothetical protein L3Q65_08275 [Amycolatopsis sp. FU40]
MSARVEWRLLCSCVFLLCALSPALPVRLFALVLALAAGAVSVCAIRPGSLFRKPQLRRRLLAAAGAGLLGMLLGWLLHAGGLVAAAAGVLIVVLAISWTARFSGQRRALARSGPGSAGLPARQAPQRVFAVAVPLQRRVELPAGKPGVAGEFGQRRPPRGPARLAQQAEPPLLVDPVAPGLLD